MSGGISHCWQGVIFTVVKWTFVFYMQSVIFFETFIILNACDLQS
jgi:hypothetical protein